MLRHEARIPSFDFYPQDLLADGSQRNTLLGIQQIIMLGELAVNRALDNLDPPE
nr:hypothetical protein [Pseudomonas sp. ANT_J28]